VWIAVVLSGAAALGSACVAPSSDEIEVAEASFALCPGARDAYAKIEAESSNAAQGVTFETTTDTGGGQDAAFISNGDFLRFDNVDFGSPGATNVNARVASGAAGGVSGLVEFHLDAVNGQLIGSFSVANTGGWQSWTTIPANVTASGLHNLFVVFKSGQPADFVNLNWIQFVGTGGGSCGGTGAGGTTSTGTTTTTTSGSGGSSGGWTVVWEDTFDGTGQPNAANWSYHVGNGFNPGLHDFQGWGNGEWEWYRPENTYLQNGNLVIRADYNSTPTTIAGKDWYQRSGRITTKGKRSWTYGRIEARISMPNKVATWPAFWMMGTACDDTVTTNYSAPITSYDTMASNWSSCGEIDIMEHRNTETVTFQNLFYDTRTGLFPWADGMTADQSNQATLGDVSQFHLYTIEWEPTQIRWYLDRDTRPTPVHTVDITAANKEEFQKPFHIIMNLALSGQFTGYAQPNKADFPLYMLVDYVRVWQRL
jgi:beta-glucanase (GH16 family)